MASPTTGSVRDSSFPSSLTSSMVKLESQASGKKYKILFRFEDVLHPEAKVIDRLGNEVLCPVVWKFPVYSKLDLMRHLKSSPQTSFQIEIEEINGSMHVFIKSIVQLSDGGEANLANDRLSVMNISILDFFKKTDGCDKLTLSPDGAFLACGRYQGSSEILIQTWALSSRQLVPSFTVTDAALKLEEHLSSHFCLAISNKNLLAVCSHRKLFIWDLSSNELKFEKPCPAFLIESMCFMDSGKQLFLRDRSGDFIGCRLEIVEGRITAPFFFRHGFLGSDNRKFAISNSLIPSPLIATLKENTLAVWSLKKENKIQQCERESNIQHFEFSPDGSRLLILELIQDKLGNEISRVVLWDVVSNLFEVMIEKNQAHKIYHATFSNHGRSILYCLDQRMISVYDIKNKKDIQHFEAPGGANAISCLALNAQENVLYTGNSKGDMFAWDLSHLPLQEQIGMVGPT